MDLSKIEALASNLSKESSYSEVEIWRSQPGRNTIRVGPPFAPQDKGMDSVFYQIVGKHWMKTPEGGVVPVTCNKLTFKQDCSICDYIKENKSNVDMKKKLGDIGVRKSYLLNVIDRNNEDSGCMVGEVPTTVFSQILSYMMDPEYGDVTSQEKGFDLTIQRDGKGINTEYSVRFARKESKQKWAQLHDLRTVLEPFDDDYVQDLLDHLSGNVSPKTTEVDDFEEEEETVPISNSKADALKAKLHSLK